MTQPILLISSPMLNYLDALVREENTPLFTETVNKVKEYLLNHSGLGQWMRWMVGKDTQTIAYRAIYDYAFRGLPYKNPIINPMIYIYSSRKYDDLAKRIQAFLKEMDTFHTEQNEPLPNYWNHTMGEVEGICREINQINASNKIAIDAFDRAAENYLPL